MKKMLLMAILLSGLTIYASTQSKVNSASTIMIDTGDGKKVKGTPMLGLTAAGVLVVLSVDDSGRVIAVSDTTTTTTQEGPPETGGL